jgi:RNA polymerase sigma factor (TIGR02999 family)
MEEHATEHMFAALYSELHRLAESHLRGKNAPLGATTLLHEAYVNVAKREDLSFSDRAHFLAYASRAMRGLMIDYVRSSRAQKRGVQFEITLADDEEPYAYADEAERLEQLGDALNELGVLEPLLAQLVDLHFFCGYTFAEIAALRNVSERTVQRDWRKARLLLHNTIAGESL